jgi:hypothetical protein
MSARREHTHDHFGSLPGQLRTARRSQASAFADLTLIATRWAALGLVLVASFWAYLGAAELAGGATPDVPAREATEAHGAGCTVLRLDRPSGRTIAAPCVGPAPILRETLAARPTEPATR